MEAVLKNNKGFALALMMALLPVMLGTLMVTWVIASFIQTDLKMNYLCRNEGLSGQQQVAPLLKTLLAMNKRATQLQIEFTAAKAAFYAAPTPQTKAKLEEVRFKVILFKAKQQELIRAANVLLQHSHISGQAKLWREQNAIKNVLPLLSGEFQVLPTNAPTLAVRPTLPDPPTYSPVEDFAHQQALEQRWQYRLTVKRPLQAFLSGDFRFEKSCAVTLKEGDLAWQPQIIKARSSSKSLW